MRGWYLERVPLLSGLAKAVRAVGARERWRSRRADSGLANFRRLRAGSDSTRQAAAKRELFLGQAAGVPEAPENDAERLVEVRLAVHGPDRIWLRREFWCCQVYFAAKYTWR
ncbi:protein of unknown function (plasmid) [Pararobbsia alpina]